MVAVVACATARPLRLHCLQSGPIESVAGAGTSLERSIDSQPSRLSTEYPIAPSSPPCSFAAMFLERAGVDCSFQARATQPHGRERAAQRSSAHRRRRGRRRCCAASNGRCAASNGAGDPTPHLSRAPQRKTWGRALPHSAPNKGFERPRRESPARIALTAPASATTARRPPPAARRPRADVAAADAGPACDAEVPDRPARGGDAWTIFQHHDPELRVPGHAAIPARQGRRAGLRLPGTSPPPPCGITLLTAVGAAW